MVIWRGLLRWSILVLLAWPWMVAPTTADERDSTPKHGTGVDAFGDPLPKGAVARIGTLRLRQPSNIYSVAFSPDGKLLATGGESDGVRLWDSSTGKLLHFLPTSGWPIIFCLAFSPDGKSLVSSGADGGSLDVWEVATGKKTRVLKEKSDWTTGPFCFSDDGKLFALLDWDAFHIWETAGWTELDQRRADQRKIIRTSFAGKRLYVHDESARDGTWDLATLDKHVIPKKWRIGDLSALSPDGKRLADVATETPLIVLRDGDSGKELHRLELPKNQEIEDAAVNALCFSKDSKLLAVGGRGIPLCCIDADTGKQVMKIADHKMDNTTRLVFSPDGKRLAAECGKAVRLWDVGSGKEILPATEWFHGVNAVAFSPNGKGLVFGDHKYLHLCDIVTQKVVWRLPQEMDYAQRIAFAPDGKTLVAGNFARLRFVDALSGKVTHSWGKGLWALHRERDPIECGLFTPDLEKVVSLGMFGGNRDPDVLVRSARTGEALFKFQRGGKQTLTANISSNGQLLAVVDREAPTRIYNVASGKFVAQLEALETDWQRLVFAPDGRTLACQDRTGSLHMMEAATGKTRLVLAAVLLPAREQEPLLWRTRKQSRFTYSPDGKVLAIWRNNTVDLWDALTGRKHGRLEGHEGNINQAAFAPGGGMLATAGDDTTILLWDLHAILRKEKPTTLSPEAAASAWKDLADPNAAKAGRAMAVFRQAGPQAVDFLRERLQPQRMPTAKQMEKWLKDLDDDQFTVREDAALALKHHVEIVVSTLRKALDAGPTPEVRRSLTRLIDLAEEGNWAPEALRTLRAIEVLEQLGSAEARKVLETLTSGIPEARLTREAKASLERLGR
jgi:WD40 repeat protein